MYRSFIYLAFSLFILPTLAFSQSQQVAVELSLLVDVSGSVSSSEFELQKNGYEAAFRSVEVKNAISQVGSIAVNLVYWSGSSSQVESIPFTRVTAGSSEQFADAIATTLRPFSGGTDVASAIDFAVPLFSSNNFTSIRQVIDVSGDGDSSESTTGAARDAALAAGIDVINGLPIGGDQAVEDFYSNFVIGGADAFIEPASTFQDFQNAVRRKIVREVVSVDQCPNDPAKIEPGICGCGTADIDSDGDSTLDCLELCPNDPNKVLPGQCGCGRADTDANGNGTPDCNEGGGNPNNNLPVCSDGLDNDGDGFIDYRADGSGDPGCSSSSDVSEDDQDVALRSPAYAKFNTFLGQQVFGEIVNQGNVDQRVSVSLYNLRGQLMIERQVRVPARGQFDIDVNALLRYACDVLKSRCDGFEDLSATRGSNNGTGSADGTVDTYGLIRLSFDDSDPNNRILGRMSFYRPSPDGGFSFAFARELRNPTTGKSFVTTNTFDPQGLSSLVPNWAEVISLGRKRPDGSIARVAQEYSLKIYSEQGALLESRKFILPALGEFDFQAGHEFTDAAGNRIEGVYLVEVRPTDPNAQYFLSSGRYSARNAQSGDAADYHFALSLEGRPGTREPIFASVRNTLTGVSGLATQPTVTNWVETACVDDVPCRVTAKVRSSSGLDVGQRIFVLLPKSQYHLNTAALLPSGTVGSVEVSSNEKIISQSMSYVHSEGSKPITGFAVPALSRQRPNKAGSLNTNIGLQNVLTLYSTTDVDSRSAIIATPIGGSSGQASLTLKAAESRSLAIANELSRAFPDNAYGILLLESDRDGAVNAEVLRVRRNDNSEIDFIMPTAVR